MTSFAVLITAGLAVWGSSGSPPDLTNGLVLTVIAGCLQAGAAWLFSHGQGTAQSDHAVSSVGNLLRLLGRAATLKDGVEKAVRKKTMQQVELRQHLGVVSVELEFIEERAIEAVGHWNQFYPDAVTKARRGLEEEGNG